MVWHPTQESCQRLADILYQKPVDGKLDLIWGPELNVEVQELVVNSEYDAYTRDIYNGLGIPPQLVTGC